MSIRRIFPCASVLALSCTCLPAQSLNWRQASYEPVTPLLVSRWQGVRASATGQWEDHGPERAIDGNREASSHWACEQLPAALTLELPTTTRLRGVHLWFYPEGARTYSYFVETSADGQAWAEGADHRHDAPAVGVEGQEVGFAAPVEAKFLRVTVTDSSQRQAGAHIVEIEPLLADEGAGLQGRVAPTVRIDAANAAAGEPGGTWRASAWRGERVNGQLVVWSRSEQPQLRVECSALSRADGQALPATTLRARFVRYVLGDGKLLGDVLDTAERVDLPADGYRPIWLSAAVPADAAPGTYRGQVTVRAAGGEALAFPVELEVLAATLPAPRDWKFFLDLWQHPWAVARYHGVEPFSPQHYQLLEPIYRELADAGQKVLTTTLVELPWNHQNFDAYHSMIGRTRAADGSWSFDYSLFDEYVEFGRRCGLGPQIHCYSILPWGYVVSWTDGPSGDLIRRPVLPGTPEFEDYWGPFLADFQAHLEARGWLEDTVIAMDERGADELRAAGAVLEKYAPRLKSGMAGNHAPSHFRGLHFDVYSQIISLIDPPFLAETRQRQADGLLTTFYVCTHPRRPNSFTFSPTSEQRWLGYYAAAHHFDGFLRWAFTNWPRDPLFDTSFGNWPAGDTFLLYPGGRSSVRWEMLRDGIEEAEKIRLLREGGAEVGELEQVLAGFDWARANDSDDAALTEQVEAARAAVEAAARGLAR